MKWKCLLLLVLISGLLATPAEAQKTNKARLREQTVFGLENGVERPVSVPEDVLEILRNDEYVRTCLKKDQSPNEITTAWFIGSEVHLDGADEVDLIVLAKNGCLLGANIGPFWVLRNTSQGHQLVLATSALSLEVMSSRTRSYRNIRGARATAGKILSVVFRFDGQKYQAHERTAKPLR